MKNLYSSDWPMAYTILIIYFISLALITPSDWFKAVMVLLSSLFIGLLARSLED